MNSNIIKKKFTPLIGINEECTGLSKNYCKNCCNSFKDSLAWCDHCISSKCVNNYSLFFNNNPKEPVKEVIVALENDEKQGIHYSKEELTQYATDSVESQLNNEIDKTVDCDSKLDEDGIQVFKKSISTTKTLDNQGPSNQIPRNRSRSPRRNNSKINHRITQQHIIRVPTKELAKFAIEAALDRGIYNLRVFVN